MSRKPTARWSTTTSSTPFAGLPARQRAAVVLRYELQLTDAEIAETLKVPIGTVKSTLHRAIARLREEVTK